MRLAFFCLIIFVVLTSTALATVSYHKFNECYVSGERCEEFKLDNVRKEISFSFIIPDYYFYDNEMPIQIYSVEIIDNPATVGRHNEMARPACSEVFFGKSEKSVSKDMISVRNTDRIYVKATGCALQDDSWFTGNIKVSILGSNTNELYGTIRKFVESESYLANEKWNTYFYRFIPLSIVILLSLLALIRVRR